MSNPFDEWHSMSSFDGALNNKTGVLSSTPVSLLLTSAGWWRLTASVPFHWRGPTAATSACSTADTHEWKEAERIVKVPTAGSYVSVVRSGAVTGVYWVDKMKGV